MPVQQQRWVSEEQVRRVPVVNTRIEYESRREPVQIQYVEQERVVQKVRRPVTRKVYVPYTETIMVPKQVVQRVPLSYYDPFAPAILNGYSSFSAPIVTSSSPAPTVSSSRPAESVDAGSSVLNKSTDASDSPQTRLQKIETTTPGDDKQDDTKQTEQEPASPGDRQPSDTDELEAPALDGPANSPSNQTAPADKSPAKEPSGDASPATGSAVTESQGASYRIKYQPLFVREI